jgi:hypothetical protein
MCSVSSLTRTSSGLSRRVCAAWCRKARRSLSRASCRLPCSWSSRANCRSSRPPAGRFAGCLWVTWSGSSPLPTAVPRQRLYGPPKTRSCSRFPGPGWTRNSLSTRGSPRGSIARCRSYWPIACAISGARSARWPAQPAMRMRIGSSGTCILQRRDLNACERACRVLRR